MWDVDARCWSMGRCWFESILRLFGGEDDFLPSFAVSVGPLWISRNLLDPIFLLILHASELRNDLPRLRTQSNRTDDIDI
jgi:hypothetical protein